MQPLSQRLSWTLVLLLQLAVWSCPTTAQSTEPADHDEAAANDSLPAGHSYHGEVFNEGPRQAAYLMDGTGPVHFPVQSKHQQVQAYIDQGVGQLHGFWFFEAERTFRQAAAIDPECAAAYWGMAMANLKNRERAQKFIQEAVQRQSQACSRVQRYIEALDKFLKTEDAEQASDDYIRALEQIVYDYPDDIEARAFIVVHLWEERGNGRKIRSHLAVDALIGEILSVQPMHPAHHYRIHLWDYEKPERALASAALCGQAAPAIAHMWHMPGHIYSRLRRYPDAVWQQEASARTDHAQMIRDRLLPDQIHNFAHNNEWLIRNLIFVGRIADALDLAKNMLELPRHPQLNTLEKSGCSASFGRTRLLQVLLDAELWQETLRLAQSPYLEKTDSPRQQTELLLAVGRAHSRLGNWSEAEEMARQLRTLRCSEVSRRDRLGDEAETAAREADKSPEDVEKAGKEARREADGVIREIDQALAELKAYPIAAEGQFVQAIELLDEANTDQPALRAQWQAASGDDCGALASLQEYVDGHAEETLPLAHLAAMQWALQRREDAVGTLKQLRELSADLDLQAPPFSRLAPIASHLDWPRDWRIPRKQEADIGVRPELDSLGPFRWAPPTAPDWTLPSARQQSISLSDYRGQPVLVIFYLGFGCLHCAEQLQAFGPRTEDFRDAGIEIVAISSDDLNGLKNSLEAYDGEIPFPLLSDNQLQVFRAYRVFDDFEDQPLHGTFLIDGGGHLRWHDISYQPFMDHEFVLTEARRLLAQPTCTSANKP